MASQFQIRTKDIPLLVRALQSLETVPDTWFGSVDDPSLISEMKNAARALPVKLRLKTLQLSILDVLALQQACCYQCLECKLSRQDYKLLEDYSNQFAALLVILVCYSKYLDLRAIHKRCSLCPPQAGFFFVFVHILSPFISRSTGPARPLPAAHRQTPWAGS